MNENLIADALDEIRRVNDTRRDTLNFPIERYLAAQAAVVEWEANRRDVECRLLGTAQAGIAADDYRAASAASAHVTDIVHRLDHTIRDEYDAAATALQSACARLGLTMQEMDEAMAYYRSENEMAPEQDEDVLSTPEPLVAAYRYYQELSADTARTWTAFEREIRTETPDSPGARALLADYDEAQHLETAAHQRFWDTARRYGFTASDRAVQAVITGHLPAVM